MGFEHEHHRKVYGPPWSEDYTAYCKCGWHGKGHRTRIAAIREYYSHKVVKIEGPNPLPGTEIGALLR